MDFSETSYLVNIKAEQAIIGAIIIEPELIKECWLKQEHFAEDKHNNLFFVMKDLDAKNIPIDLVSIVERIGNTKVEKIGGIGYLSNLAGSIPTTANFNYYQGIVFEYYQKRQTNDIGRQLMQGIIEGEPGQVIQNGIDDLTAIGDNDADDGDGNIKDGLVRVYDWMEQDHGEITGAATGFKELDRILSGLQRQDLVIVGARPSVGKTAFAIEVCKNYSEIANGPSAIFSLEMPEDALIRRMISNTGNIDAQRMRNPQTNFQGDDWGKTAMAMGVLSKIPLHIFDKSGVDIAYIRKKCRMMTRKYPGEHVVVMVDYLQLVVGNPKHGGNRTAEISEISRSLKHVARELDITIIALSQLSRGVEQRQDKRPMMSDLRESGQIEQDADVIAFLYRDDYYDKESEKKDIIEIIIAKQRNGPTGTVELAFVKEYGKFCNLDRRYDN